MTSSYKTEMSIPVNRDSRTFEQRRQDMLTNLERSYNSKSTTSTRGIVPGSDTTASSFTSDTQKLAGRPANAVDRYRDDWGDEVNGWIQETRKRWNEDMRRMRQDMFALQPMDEFDLDSWDNFGLGSTSTSSMMAEMERQMQSLRQQMDSMSGLEQTTTSLRGGPSSGPAGHTQLSSSRFTTSTSTSSSTGDPRAGFVTRSNVHEKVQQSRTVDGLTTGSQSESTYATSSNAPNAGGPSKDWPGALATQTSLTGGGMMDFLKDAYELGEDGKVHFKVHFDAKDFAPEDIDVTTVNNRLTVHAKKNVKSGQTTTSREFCRTIDLPRSIDHAGFQCNLTEDGVLILDAPVDAPNYESITFNDEHQLGIRPKSISEVGSMEKTEKTSTLAVTGQAGPTILKDGADGRKLHLEVPIDASYKADELCVRMDANRICVTGKRGKVADHQRTNGAESSSSFSSFTRSYEIPETVDPFSVSAQLIGTTLIIEAPLLCTV